MTAEEVWSGATERLLKPSLLNFFLVSRLSNAHSSEIDFHELRETAERFTL